MDQKSTKFYHHTSAGNLPLENFLSEAQQKLKANQPAAIAAKHKFSDIYFILGGLVILQLMAAVFIVTVEYPGSQDTTEPVIAFKAPSHTEPLAPSSVQFSGEVDLANSGETLPNFSTPDLTKLEAAPVRAKHSDIYIRGLEVTQGIQVFNEPENARCHSTIDHPQHIFCNNSIPLVAGRHTMLRLYMSCAADCPVTDLTAQVRLLQDGVEQDVVSQLVSVETFNTLKDMPVAEARLDLSHSINFNFFPPPQWMSGPITFEVDILDGQTSQASLSETHNFIIRKPLKVAYLPIQYQGAVPPAPDATDYWLERLYPVPTVEYYRLPVPDLVWDREMSKGEMLQELYYVYWLYTENHPPEEWPDQLFGWLPQEYFNGGASDPDWCQGCAGPHSSRVAFGGWRPEQDIGAARILVHEIGHNLGAQHAWSPTQRQDGTCFKAEGADIQVDPRWPYAETPYIQEVGLDLYSDPPVLYPPFAYDMMAYCAYPWISPYTYRNIFNSAMLQPNANSQFQAATFQLQDEPHDMILLKGVVYPDGQVSRPTIIQLEDSQRSTTVLSTQGNYCLQVNGFDGTTLSKHCFDAGFVDVETGLATEPSPYFVTIAAVDLAEVASVTLTERDAVLIEITPSATPPAVTITYPRPGERLQGEQIITWTGSDADGDLLTYDLLYSPDGGERWLPLATGWPEESYTLSMAELENSGEALIQVKVNDGFYTNYDQVAQLLIKD